MTYFWLGVELVSMVAVEPLSWKHLLQAVLMVVTIAILVWQRKKLHPRTIVAIALMMLGSALGTIIATVRLGSELTWWLEMGPLLLYATAVVLLISLWYRRECRPRNSKLRSHLSSLRYARSRTTVTAGESRRGPLHSGSLCSPGRGEVFENVPPQTPDSDSLALHGRFADSETAADETGRVAIGVYQRPVLEGAVPNLMSVVAGHESEVTRGVRGQAERAAASDAIKAVVGSHPVFSVSPPDTIIHVEVASRWRDTWDNVLSYSDSEDDDECTVATSIEVPERIRRSASDDSARFAVHYIDGQDLHRPTRLLGIVEAASYTEAIHAVETEYTRMRCPPNWEFEIVEIAAEHDYPIESFEFDIDFPREAGSAGQ
jgi:hypothetical protein